MKNTLKEYAVTVGVGVVDYLPVLGNGVQLRSASVPVRIKNDRIGLDVTLSQGDAVEDLDEFTELQISHDSVVAQQIVVAVGVGRGMSKSALVAGLPADQGAYTQAAKTVTTASGELLAANAARRVLGVQNQHATGSVWLNFSGDSATTASGWRLLPGDALYMDAFAPTEAIYAIGDVASNASVIVIEG